LIVRRLSLAQERPQKFDFQINKVDAEHVGGFGHASLGGLVVVETAKIAGLVSCKRGREALGKIVADSEHGGREDSFSYLIKFPDGRSFYLPMLLEPSPREYE
jgi:hypothetical protein